MENASRYKKCDKTPGFSTLHTNAHNTHKTPNPCTTASFVSNPMCLQIFSQRDWSAQWKNFSPVEKIAAFGMGNKKIATTLVLRQSTKRWWCRSKTQRKTRHEHASDTPRRATQTRTAPSRHRQHLPSRNQPLILKSAGGPFPLPQDPRMGPWLILFFERPGNGKSLKMKGKPFLKEYMHVCNVHCSSSENKFTCNHALSNMDFWSLHSLFSFVFRMFKIPCFFDSQEGAQNKKKGPVSGPIF